MKKLSDDDIKKMILREFAPNLRDVNKNVRTQLKLGQLIPTTDAQPEKQTKIDLHNLTVEQAWDKIMCLAKSGTRRATIITGASGVLKIKFQEWVKDSLLSPYIISATAVNNGSFDVRFFKKNKLATN